MILSPELAAISENFLLQALNEINNHERWFVYLLKDPTTNKYEYAGKTKNPEYRMAKHIQEAKTSEPKKPKDKWICDLLSSGLRPIMEYRRICSLEEAKIEEQKLIDYYKSRGEASYNLRNAVQPIGRRGFPGVRWQFLSEEQKNNITYRYVNPKTKAKLIAQAKSLDLADQIWLLQRKKEKLQKDLLQELSSNPKID